MRPVTFDPEEIRRFLSTTELFGGLDDDLQGSLAESFEAVLVDAGDIVIAEGDPARCLYLLNAGRLRIQRRTEHEVHPLGEVSPGETVGELALVTDRPRSATVVASRDSRLLRLDLNSFEAIVQRHPSALRAMTTQVVDHLERPRPTGRRLAVLSIVALHESTLVDRAIDDLAHHLRQGGARVGVLRGVAGDDDRHFSIHRLEQVYDLVVAIADTSDAAWTASCVHQADRVLVVADATRAPATTESDAVVDKRRALLPVRTELLLVHPSSTHEPRATETWLAVRDVDRHHHLRAGEGTHAARVARLITDQGMAVTFSGGGARSLAQIGAVEVLIANGFALDAVSGTSAGSLVAGAFARGWPLDRVTRTLRRYLVDAGRPIEPTLPVVSFSSGKRMTERLREVCGDMTIEDTWLDFACVSTNLTRRQAVVHRDGPVWRAVRASMSIPGLFPPVAWNGDVLVDGGVLDNLPVGVVRDHHPDIDVIAIDVGVRRELTAGALPETTIVRGWDVVRQRLRPGGDDPVLVGIGPVMARLAELGGHRGDDADAVLTIRPDVGHVGMLDFARFDELVEAGRVAARRALAGGHRREPRPAGRSPGESVTPGDNRGQVGDRAVGL